MPAEKPVLLPVDRACFQAQVTPSTPTVTKHKQPSNLSNSCLRISWTQNHKSRRCRENWRKERESGLDMGSDGPNESTRFERRGLPDSPVSSSIPTLKTPKSPRVDIPGAFIRESLCYDNIGGGIVPSTKSDGGFLSSPKEPQRQPRPTCILYHIPADHVKE